MVTAKQRKRDSSKNSCNFLVGSFGITRIQSPFSRTGAVESRGNHAKGNVHRGWFARCNPGEIIFSHSMKPPSTILVGPKPARGPFQGSARSLWWRRHLLCVFKLRTVDCVINTVSRTRFRRAPDTPRLTSLENAPCRAEKLPPDAATWEITPPNPVPRGQRVGKNFR